MKLRTICILFVILCIGAFFRLYNTNWDQNFHLHPDERFLTMVGIKESLPTSISQYFNPATSPLSPYNLGFSFFVYGVLPLTINFLLTIPFHTQFYDLFSIQGRIVVACVDIVAILVVYLLASLLQKEFHLPSKTKFFSAFFYAIAVLPIQLSHFFTVDLLLSFFILLSTYFLIYFVIHKQLWALIASGVSLGFAIACKINAAAVIPLDIVLLIFSFIENKKITMRFFLFFIIFCISTYLSLRIANPYLFATGNFLDFRMNTDFLQSIKTLTYYANPHVWYPPNVQWANKLPIIFSLYNIAFFGLGIGIFTFTVLGIVSLLRTKKILALVIVSWVILFFLYQSLQYVKTMRYFIFLYPFFSFFAGVGFALFLKKKPHIILLLFSILVIVIWPLAFLSIYTKPHTRITASDWITNTIPPRSTILGEYWDDPLPLVNSREYTIDLLHVFDPETPAKWTTIHNQLSVGEYLVLSSNRGWGSIMTDPETYPKMSAWYHDLFSGKLAYKKIAEFHSFPSLSYLGIPITFPDDWAEEAFIVYDHPVVFVFKKE